MLPTLIMIIVLVVFWFMIMNQQGGGGKAMQFGKSRAKMQKDSDLKKITFDDVAGLDEEKEKANAKFFGCWRWGAGYEHNPIEKAEYARDTNFRAMYGAWDAIKNHDGDYKNYRIAFSSHIAGKRESRRLLGTLVITKNDLIEGKSFPDAIIGIDWGLDLHTPNRKYYKSFVEGDAFLCSDGLEKFKTPSQFREAQITETPVVESPVEETPVVEEPAIEEPTVENIEIEEVDNVQNTQTTTASEKLNKDKAVGSIFDRIKREKELKSGQMGSITREDSGPDMFM
jgi:hypothetical protein